MVVTARDIVARNRAVLIAALPVAAVAVIAGVVSYSHIEALGLATGQSIADARLLPLAVDGLIVAGSVVLLAGSWLGWLGVIPGVGATVFGNVMSALPHGALAATVAAWPAAAFTLASFMLERWLKTQVTKVHPATAPAAVPRAASRRTKRAASKANPEVHFADAIAAGELPSVRRIQRELRVGQPKAQQIRAQLATVPPAEQS